MVAGCQLPPANHGVIEQSPRVRHGEDLCCGPNETSGFGGIIHRNLLEAPWQPHFSSQASRHPSLWGFLRFRYISIYIHTYTYISAFVLLLDLNFFYYCVIYEDHVFDESCSNATVYDVLTKDIIRAALEGFNGMFSFSFSFFLNFFMVWLFVLHCRKSRLLLNSLVGLVFFCVDLECKALYFVAEQTWEKKLNSSFKLLN